MTPESILKISQYFGSYKWLVVSTPLKNMKVNWDYYSQYMESHKIPWFQTTNQLEYWKSIVLDSLSLMHLQTGQSSRGVSHQHLRVLRPSDMENWQKWPKQWRNPVEFHGISPIFGDSKWWTWCKKKNMGPGVPNLQTTPALEDENLHDLILQRTSKIGVVASSLMEFHVELTTFRIIVLRNVEKKLCYRL